MHVSESHNSFTFENMFRNRFSPFATILEIRKWVIFDLRKGLKEYKFPLKKS